MAESRKHPRFACTGLAELNAVEGGKRGWGHLADISEGGVYLSTTHPWACGVQVNFVLQMNDVEIHGKGEVVTSHVGVGMGDRGEDRGDTGPAHGDDGGVARGREVAELEV